MKQTIGKFLATLRKAKGLTQEEVADELNISNKTLSSWETDRTTPDALTLPAIADLYEVTVDEILRGERAKGNEQAQISEKAKRALTKKKYGKFSVKHFMFTVFGMLANAVNVLGCAFLTYAVIPEWVGILLFVIGLCGAVILTILLIFFEYTTLLSEGTIEGGVLREDAEEEMKRSGNSLALCVKRKNSISLKLFSLPYWALTIATLIVLLVEASVVGDRTSVFIGFICATAIIGAVYMLWGSCSGSAAVKKYGNDVQRTAHEKNKKLFRIVSIVCSSVVAACLTVAFVLSLVTIEVLNPSRYKEIEETKVYTKDFEQFRELSQTLILDDKTVDKYNLPSNKFVLKLPEDIEENGSPREGWIDLGYGFYGRTTGFTDGPILKDEIWGCEIYYKVEEILNEQTGETQDVYDIVAHRALVKVYHDKSKQGYDYIVYLPIQVHTRYQDPRGEFAYFLANSSLIHYQGKDYVGKNFSTGKYGLYSHEYYYVFPFVWHCFVFMVGVDLGVCAIVYWKKRKKIIYKI